MLHIFCLSIFFYPRSSPLFCYLFLAFLSIEIYLMYIVFTLRLHKAIVSQKTKLFYIQPYNCRGLLAQQELARRIQIVHMTSAHVIFPD